VPAEPSLVDPNIARFRNSEVVEHYANLSGPWLCEASVFGTYIAPGSDILDLGVGAGRTAALLAPLARTYLGVDYSHEMIEAARRNFPQYRFAVMDVADMSSLASESFDVIVFPFNGIANLYPDNKRLSCIRDCHRLLRRRGLFVFSHHNPRSLFLRPRRASRSLASTIKGLLVSLWENANRVCWRIQTRSFWLGHGYMPFPLHGGLLLFTASAAFVRRELDAAGFDFVADYTEGHPRRTSQFLTRWNYYVFRKRGA
jgi:SAM-dependent methyltransferase